MNTELLQNLLSSDIVWQILIALAMLLLFRSVPKETLDKLEKRASETESTADDMAIKVLRWLNANKEILPTLIPETPQPQPTVSAPAPVIYPAPDSTVTISAPPVGNTGTGTMDTSTPPIVVLPEQPAPFIGVMEAETRNMHPYGSRLDYKYADDTRIVHVPENMSYVYDLADASGKEWKHPNVNVNASYGARFDIAFIAGSWGFGLLTTLVHNQAYDVSVDYTGEVNPKAGSPDMREWLWWELETLGIDNKATRTSYQHGIENGRHIVKWRVTGTGLPVTLQPRIRALWANAGSNSAVTWHSVTVAPVLVG